MSKLLFALFVLVLCGTYCEVSALRCWDCRSDGIDSSFCGDYFDKDLISDQQRNYVNVNCSVPESIKKPNTVPKIAVCRVMKQTENLTTIIYRGCHYQEDGLPRNCLHNKYATGIKTEYCLTCSTDGCNAALDFNLLKYSLLANKGVARGSVSALHTLWQITFLCFTGIFKFHRHHFMMYAIVPFKTTFD